MDQSKSSFVELQLTLKELRVLNKLAREQEMSMNGVIRQALRLYQAFHEGAFDIVRIGPHMLSIEQYFEKYIAPKMDPKQTEGK